MNSIARYILVAAVSFSAGAGGYAFYQKHQRQSYAGLETREIKSLSADELKGLKEGKGLGYALSAELNGYPGPRHVLELAEKLKLTPDQQAQTELLFADMQRESSALGEKLIEVERAIDQGFQQRLLDSASLDSLTGDAAEIDGKLRATHLKYHLGMMALLNPEQVASYVQLRGYAGGGHTGH
jgi:Spy/CpxP family protein refolding chaperone